MLKKRFSTPSYLSILLIAASLITEAKGQNYVVTGTVKDIEGHSLIGVNVIEKETTRGTLTDLDGKYSLETSGRNIVLTFSYIGYTPQEISIGNKKEIDIILHEDVQKLEEVVVIGYGTARKKDLTGSISSIRTEKLEAEAPRSVQDLLRANAAGMIVGMANSAKGDATLLIRGDGTLKADSGPLYVVDGVIFDGTFADINPNDISSIDILKDASSAAVYGAKAANGVILLTTKKGQSGKPRITFNANMGFVENSNMPRVMNAPEFLDYRYDYEIGKRASDYLAKYPQMFVDPRKLEGVNQLDWYNYDQKTPVTSVTEEQLLRTWLSRLELKTPETENYLTNKITDWQGLVFQTGFQQDYTASISNRSDNLSYYWSLNYVDRKGIIVGNRFQNIRSRLNVESKITDFLKVGLNANFADRNEGFLQADWEKSAVISPYGSDNRDDPNSIYQRLPTGDPTPVNPFYDNQYRDRRNRYNTFNASIYAIVSLPYGFEYQVNYTPSYIWHEYFNHESSQNQEWKAKGGNSERQHEKTFNWQVDNIIRWKKEYNDIHKFEVTLLQNAEKGQYWQTIAKTSNYSPSDILGYHRLQAGTVPLVSSNDTYKTGDALMGRIYYSLHDKYMLTASIRRDGYSAFGLKNPRATFPAVALGWVFTSEDFMRKTDSWLNYGKLRLSWGKNGNRDLADQYTALSDMTSGLHPYIDQNGNIYLSSYLYVNRMANSGLKWESKAAYNLGLDFSLFKDILSGSVEVYTATTHDLLVDRALPEIIGFNSVAANLGELQNKGFEVTLNANIMKRENFEWSGSANFSLNRREIKKLYGDMVDVKDSDGNVIGQKEADDIKNQWFIGQDPDRIWDYERIGVWQLGEEDEAAKYGCQPGDFKYKDQNRDGVMTDNDKVFQKYKTPRFRWTFRNDFRLFKDFDLSFLLYSYWGYYNTFNRAANNSNFPDRCSGYALPRWTPNNPINDYARVGSKNIGNNYVNRSFIRLDNITASYNVPPKFLKKFFVQNMRLTLSVRNAAMWAPEWDFGDPESGADPTPRTYNLSVNFTL
ncbi:TonB-dependent receptor [Parabacteroides sp. Marseille-P3160]|uniref:SusC/RagA family TonB-linked outer membrane protein n=1 Tax=Parabacteroides sp. Marseille-P3160 TaxID=1917887 RepID=UPI0009BBE9DC|nr:TonB-dependent receptor [Parabacteroides sp. Marseille-P3160]